MALLSLLACPCTRLSLLSVEETHVWGWTAGAYGEALWQTSLVLRLHNEMP
jgi:uncharacterized protein YbaR (Trm112 family)